MQRVNNSSGTPSMAVGTIFGATYAYVGMVVE